MENSKSDSGDRSDVPNEVASSPESRPSGNNKQNLRRRKSEIGWFQILEFTLVAVATVISILAYLNSVGVIRTHATHDVVARVLNVTFYPRGWSNVDSNGLLCVDLALINKGNQTEIIRNVHLYYDFGDVHVQQTAIPGEPMNLVLNQGEKRVLRLNADRGIAFTGKKMWMGVAVRTIAPDAEDTVSQWRVCTIEYAPDGNGGSHSYDKAKTPMIQVISNNRLPHQKPVEGMW